MWSCKLTKISDTIITFINFNDDIELYNSFFLHIIFRKTIFKESEKKKNKKQGGGAERRSRSKEMKKKSVITEC